MGNRQNHYDRRAEHHRTERNRAWSRGFAIGVISTCIVMALFIYGQREAYGAERPAPHNAKTFDTTGFPPHWRTWLRIGMCEQPKRGVSWHEANTDAKRFRNIAWRQSYNWSYPGGLGFTRESWRMFRRPSQRNVEYMSSATPVEQMWAAERLWRWAERTYPTNGHTAWDCSETIGWTTSDPNDAL